MPAKLASSLSESWPNSADIGPIPIAPKWIESGAILAGLGPTLPKVAIHLQTSSQLLSMPTRCPEFALMPGILPKLAQIIHAALCKPSQAQSSFRAGGRDQSQPWSNRPSICFESNPMLLAPAKANSVESNPSSAEPNPILVNQPLDLLNPGPHVAEAAPNSNLVETAEAGELGPDFVEAATNWHTLVPVDNTAVDIALDFGLKPVKHARHRPNTTNSDEIWV